MPVTKIAYILTTALKSAQRKGGPDVKKRRYHGQSRKSRLLAVMLVMAMLLGMSTISVYAGELTGDISMEQVDVDVGEAGTQKDTTESTAQEKTDKVQEEMEPSGDDQPETEQTCLLYTSPSPRDCS